MDVDEIFTRIGEFGLFQKLVCALVTFPVIILSAFVTFNQLFMAEVPDHWCRVPEIENFTKNATLLKYLSIPTKANGGYERCLMYNFNWTEIEKIEGFFPNNSWPVQSCNNGWEFNTSIISHSIVIDYNLVCADRIYPTLGLVLANLSGPFGAFVFGLINDRFGRKTCLFLCVSTALFSNFLTAFSININMWLLTRLVVGLTVPALFHIGFISTLEIIGPNYRSFFTFLTGIMFALSSMLLACVTYLIPDWRIMSVVTSAPFVLIFIPIWILPESPRWLLAKRRPKEAIHILKKIGEVNNGCSQSFQLDEEIPLQSSDEKSKLKNANALDLFRTPNMRLKTILISFMWTAGEFVYIGLSYYGPALGDESHLSFFLSSFVEIPACILCLCTMDKYGRKYPLSALLTISGIFCIITVLLPSDAKYVLLVLFLTSKFAIAASYLIIFTFAGELFPTDVRGMGLAVGAYVCGVGRIFLPLITDLGSQWLVLPLVILGALSVLGGFLTLKLPETLHQPLPQTVQEGEEFGKNVSWFECIKKPPS